MGSPKKALEMLKNGAEFDVVVSDVMMPEMTGPELYARCYVSSPDLARRFIFASGDPTAARALVAKAAKRVGASHAPRLIEKPSSVEVFVAAILATAADTDTEPKSGTYSLAFETNELQERTT